MLATAQPYAWQQAQQRWLQFQGTLALVVLRRRCVYVARRFADLGICRAGGVAARRRARLPVVLGVVLHLGQRSTRRPLAAWFWADSRQQLSGLSLALMALLLALAVNVGVGTMVESFSRTFTGWLDGRLAADIYLNAADDAQAARSSPGCSNDPKWTRSCRAARAEVQIDGWPIEILGFADHATYRDRWPLLQAGADVWDRLRSGDAALISEQFARRVKLGLGDRLQVPAPSGSWPLEVVGIYADYGNPKGQIGVNIDALLQRFPGIPQTRFGLRVAPASVPGAHRGYSEQSSASMAATSPIRRR